MARGFELDRRSFLTAATAALLVPRRLFAADPAPADLPTDLLEKSDFVYVSPLRKDGAESTCHGEVWFGWMDGAVFVNSRRGTWKVHALEKGLDRARIWVGNHGRWKGVLPTGEPNEAFRAAPHFEARARFESDRKLNDRLLELYAKKYGDQFDRWHEDMQAGFFSGQRKLIRYEPG
jgi:hypothetical protein